MVASIAAWLSLCNSRCLLAIYKHPSWGRHHSLQAVLNRQEKQEPPTTHLCQLIQLVVRKNSFVSIEMNYLHVQVRGTTMYGAIICQPVHVEAGTRGPADPWQDTCTSSLVKVYWRHLCHIGPWWTIFKSLRDNINCLHSTFKFTASWSAKEVTFLNTRVYPKDSQIGTDLYVKPTDTHQYFWMDSCHPQHCKSSLPYKALLH